MRTPTWKWILAFLLSLFLSGCTGKSVRGIPPVGERTAFVYVQPFPREAERLAFTVERISAVREDLTEFPFSLSLPEISVDRMTRERLLASADLPPGRYLFLSIKVNNASLDTGKGKADLRVPEEPATIPFPFTVARDAGIVLSLKYDHAGSFREAFSFAPEFSCSVPAKLNPAVAGLVTIPRANRITVFDKGSGRVSGVVLGGRGPSGIVLDHRLTKAYVSLSGEDSIGAVDLLSYRITDKGRLRGGDDPREIALSADGSTLLVANAGSNSVSIVDPRSLQEKGRILLGSPPRSVLADPGGGRAYVFNTLSDTISVIDVRANTVSATLRTDPRPLRGQLNRRGDMLYVIHESSSFLSVVDTSTFKVVKRAAVGSGAISLKVDPANDQVYLGRRGQSEVEVLDPISLSRWDSVRTGGEVAYMTIDGEERNLAVVLPGEMSLRMVHLISKRVAAEIDLGAEPDRVTLAGER